MKILLSDRGHTIKCHVKVLSSTVSLIQALYIKKHHICNVICECLTCPYKEFWHGQPGGVISVEWNVGSTLFHFSAILKEPVSAQKHRLPSILFVLFTPFHTVIWLVCLLLLFSIQKWVLDKVVKGLFGKELNSWGKLLWGAELYRVVERMTVSTLIMWIILDLFEYFIGFYFLQYYRTLNVCAYMCVSVKYQLVCSISLSVYLSIYVCMYYK